MRAREMIGVGAVLAMVALSSGRAAEVRTQVGDVKDSRTTGKFFANLEIELKLMGDDFEGAKGLRCIVTKAIDDTGKSLVKQEKEKNDFTDIDSNESNQNQVTLQLKNPSRKAATVKEISGEIEIFKPDSDPSSMITVTNFVGKPKVTLSSPTLTASKMQVTVQSKEQYDKDAKESKEKPSGKAGIEEGVEQMGEGIGKAFAGMFGGMMGGGKNSIIVQVKDPQSKLIKIEFLDASGKTVRSQGCMTMGEVRSYDFEEPPPTGTQFQVYVATPKSLVKAPFVIRDIFLP